MSVPVAVDALAKQIDEFGGAFLITAGSDGEVHVVSAAPRVDGDALMVGAGRSSRANIAANPKVTLLWPAAPGGDYSLIVDGAVVANVDGDDDVRVRPDRAVLHRVVDAPGEGPRCIDV
jgi:hypothetical protein